jgi:hypothetical protein
MELEPYFRKFTLCEESHMLPLFAVLFNCFYCPAQKVTLKPMELESYFRKFKNSLLRRVAHAPTLRGFIQLLLLSSSESHPKTYGTGVIFPKIQKLTLREEWEQPFSGTVRYTVKP